MRQYLRIWLAGARYSIVRTLMFRGDFAIWSLVELFWMTVSLLIVSILYRHTSSIAGWSEYEMVLLVGTALLIQRLLMGFFWSSLFEMSRNVRTGAFDFILAQPGNPLFMASTRKLDPDGLVNAVVAAGVVVFAARKLHLHPSAADLGVYALLVLGGLVIHYSILVCIMSLSFWLTSAQGIEGCYFTMTDFARLPREAYRGLARTLAVWALPVVVITNAPARTLLHGFQPRWALATLVCAAGWMALALFVFNRGIRRYASASS